MSVTSRYREAWEGFRRATPKEPGAVFWDAEPVLTAVRHLAVFEPRLTGPGLPLIDLGCGNGTQTRFLADRLPYVLGADLSAAALDRARGADPDGRAAYRRLDAAEKAESQVLHAELGDANVYMRGVLHQCAADDRQALVDGIATVVGDRGRAFLVEPSEAAGAILRALATGPGGPPSGLAPVLRHGIPPARSTTRPCPSS